MKVATLYSEQMDANLALDLVGLVPGLEAADGASMMLNLQKE